MTLTTLFRNGHLVSTQTHRTLNVLMGSQFRGIQPGQISITSTSRKWSTLNATPIPRSNAQSRTITPVPRIARIKAS